MLCIILYTAKCTLLFKHAYSFSQPMKYIFSQLYTFSTNLDVYFQSLQPGDAFSILDSTYYDQDTVTTLNEQHDLKNEDANYPEMSLSFIPFKTIPWFRHVSLYVTWLMSSYVFSNIIITNIRMEMFFSHGLTALTRRTRINYIAEHYTNTQSKSNAEENNM